MTGAIYQRFSFWFSPLILSIFVLSYQNCSDVAFQRVGGNEGPSGLACLPDNFDLEMNPSAVSIGSTATFSVDPIAPNTTYTWDMNGDQLGAAPTMDWTFNQAGTFVMRVTALKSGCNNPRVKAMTLTLEPNNTCNLDALQLTGDSWGMVNEVLDYQVNHNCNGLTFAWNAGDGTTITNTNNQMSHDWDFPGIYVVSTNASSEEDTVRLAMPVSIQKECPTLDELFVSGPDVAFINDSVQFNLRVPGCLNLTTINWSFGANSNPSSGTGINPSTTAYSVAGVKTVSVDVTDNQSRSRTLTHRITILNDSNPCDEAALLTLSGPTVGTVNQNLRYSVYVPSCMQATAFTWNFGNSTGGSGNPVNVAYAQPGVYNVSVIVSTVNHGFITLSRRVLIHALSGSYSWQQAGWTACTGPCGSNLGTRSNPFVCIDSNNNNNIVDDSLCPQPKPMAQVESCTVPAATCTCTPPLTNVNGQCVITTNGLCAVAPPGLLSVENSAVLPALCNPGNPNPANITVAAGQTVTYSCVGSGTGSTQSNCRVTRCNANQTVQNGVCTTIQSYSWRETWSPCTGACGVNQGSQFSSYQCVNSSGTVMTDESLCPQPKPPSTTRACTVPANTCTCTLPSVNVNGVCVTHGQCKSPPNGGSYNVAPASGTANLCTQGNASAITTTTNSFTWTCASTNGGNTANCSAARVALSCPVGYHPNTANDVCVRWNYVANGCSSNQCGINGTTTYNSVCVNTAGVPVTGCNPALNQPPQGVVCSPNPNTCTCTPPQVNVGGSCVTPVNGLCAVAPPGVLAVNHSASLPALCNPGNPNPANITVAAGQTITYSCMGSNTGTTQNNCQVRRCQSNQTAQNGSCVTNETYSWRESWGSCTGACGTNQGLQYSSYQCINSGGTVVVDQLCPQPKPPQQSRACTVRACNSCSLGGVTVGHNLSRVFYTTNIVACGQTCDGQLRTCNDGVLSGSNSYNQAFCNAESCSYSWDIGEYGACSATQCGTSGTRTRSVVCRRSDGLQVSDTTCVNNGAGAKPQESIACSARACNSCTLDNVTVAHGVSRSFFSSSSVACGQTCQSEVRTCNDGTFGGNNAFSNANCSTGTCSSCTLDGVTVAHGSSRDFFSSSTVACGQTCQSMTRTCNNGVLSGSYAYASANCSAAACNYQWRLINTYAVFDDPFSIPAPVYCHPYNVYSLPGGFFGQPPQVISAPPACNASNAEGWYFHTRSTVPGCGNSVSQGVIQDQYQCVIVP